MSDNIELCPVCGMGHLHRQAEIETFEHHGVELQCEDYFDVCDVCGTESATQEAMRESVRSKQRAKNAHDELLCGDVIREFRVSMGLNQRQASELFGGGPTAFAKYEADDIAHNLSMDRLLRLCMVNPANIVELSRLADMPLPSETVKKISDAMEAKLRALIDDISDAFGGSKAYKPASESANEDLFSRYVETIDETDDDGEREWAIAA